MNVFDLSLLSDKALAELVASATAEQNQRNYYLDSIPPLTGEEFQTIQSGRFVQAVRAYKDRTGCSTGVAVALCRKYKD